MRLTKHDMAIVVVQAVLLSVTTPLSSSMVDRIAKDTRKNALAVQYQKACEIVAQIRKADAILGANSGFANFRDLLDAKGGYAPSMDMRKPELVWLADYYDQTQASRNDPRRAFRYGQA